MDRFFKNILGDRSSKLGLLIGTTFDPCYFSLDNTFKFKNPAKDGLRIVNLKIAPAPADCTV